MLVSAAQTYAATPMEVPPLLMLLLLVFVQTTEAELARGACERSDPKMEPFACGALRLFVITASAGRLLPLSFRFQPRMKHRFVYSFAVDLRSATYSWSRSLPAEPYVRLQQNSNFDHCPFCHVGLMETYASHVAALLSSYWIRTGSTSSMYREGTCRIS